MHLHAVDFLRCSNISTLRLTITGYLQSKHGDIRVAIGITTGHHLLATLCSRLFFCAASFCDRRLRTFLDGSAREETLRSMRPNFKSRWATISREYW